MHMRDIRLWYRGLTWDRKIAWAIVGSITVVLGSAAIYAITFDQPPPKVASVSRTQRPTSIGWDPLWIAQQRVVRRLGGTDEKRFLNSRQTRESPAVFCGKVITEDYDGDTQIIRWVVVDTQPFTEWGVGKDSLDRIWWQKCT